MSTSEAAANRDPEGSVSGRSSRRWIQRQLAVWSRWLHIYLSLMSFGAILFFSITGLTLNHPDWFFSESTKSVEGTVPREWLHLQQPPPENRDESDYGHEVDRLAVVEFLRGEHGLSGRMTEFLSFQDECEVTFQGPGYAATARIRRDDGTYSISVISNDLVSMLNDLHKGRHTGAEWSVVIDISAIISALVAITGLILVFFLKLHRKLRLSLAVAGILLILWMFRIAIN
ncbi:MAG: PepSY-associated TM helix domain-containing protein [Planctomyces sp.]|nr:PepSY-associated TM helix domain-containing protein [Planctomyces sp.]